MGRWVAFHLGKHFIHDREEQSIVLLPFFCWDLAEGVEHQGKHEFESLEKVRSHPPKERKKTMSYEMTGKVKVVNDTMSFPSGFSKREFVVTTDEQYPQDVAFEVVKEKTTLLDSLQPGQQVTVHFDVRGREYNGRYFVNLNAWRIQTEDSPASPAKPGRIPPMAAAAANSAEEEEPPF